ncbi:MAG: roadblock/LC7 domain-containing protein [Thermoleophilia bacterium]
MQDNKLATRLAPYRQVPGMAAALLISRDGFVIAADTEAGFNADAFAAQAGAVIDNSAHLAEELEETGAKYIAMEFGTYTLVLAPFNEELFLALVGRSQALSFQYRLNTGPA